MAFKETLKPEAFDALCSLIRVQSGPSREAARLVLVEGVVRTQAAQQTGITVAGVSNLLTRLKRAKELAKIVAEE